VTLNSRARFARYAFGIYLVLVLIVLPLLAPLRALGLIEPGELRNMLLPPMFLMMIMTVGPARLIGARSVLQLGLAFAFVMAAVIGFSNAIDPASQRNYFSHLFQVASAFVMFGFGVVAFDWFGHQYWRRFAWLALISTFISSAVTLDALGRGDIGRLYTPAYAFVFVAAFSALHSKKLSILSVLGLLVSNKRGPVVAVMLIFFQHMLGTFMAGKKLRQARVLAAIFWGAIVTVTLAVAVSMLFAWAADPANEDSPVARAVNITYGRMVEVAQAGNTGRTLDDISAGRVDEIETALETLDGFDFLVGSGAGWAVNLGEGEGRDVQNIHFTPLSITAVFGAPFAIFLYVYLVVLVFRGSWRKEEVESLTTTERMAPLYLSGALLHSLFAYSLFIDWLVFFFAGVLIKSLRTRRKNAQQAGALRA
jgi:hypothetical protein